MAEAQTQAPPQIPAQPAPQIQNESQLQPPAPPQRKGSTVLPPAEQATLQLQWQQKYRGATISDLDLPPALSTSPSTPLHSALTTATSHDYSHLTVLSDQNRSLLGYLPVSRLKSLFESRTVDPNDPVEKAMIPFQRRRYDGKGNGQGESQKREYRVITMDTELWELEGFFENVGEYAVGGRQDFAVVTDGGRKFVLGVATREDLREFVKRRPA